LKGPGKCYKRDVVRGLRPGLMSYLSVNVKTLIPCHDVQVKKYEGLAALVRDVHVTLSEEQKALVLYLSLKYNVGDTS
jgi:hypothetical protein